MTIPNLPTDNLYKFCAILGLVIYLLAFFYPSWKISELKTENIILKGDDDKIDVKLKIIEKYNRKIEAKIKLSEDELSRYKDDTLRISIDMNQYRKNLQDKVYQDYLKFLHDYEDEVVPGIRIHKEITKLLNDLDEKNTEVDLLLIDRKVKSELWNKKLDEIHRLMIHSIVGYILGTILCLYGFRQWYHKIQKPSDEKLKKESM